MKFTKCLLATCLFTLSLTGVMAAQLEFKSQPYENQLVGKLVAGQSVTVNYDTNRLAKCTAMGRLFQSFTAIYYRFDNGDVQSSDTMATGGLLLTATIAIPQNAQSLEIWFRNYTLASPNYPAVCDAYDSDFGNNYRYEIQK